MADESKIKSQRSAVRIRVTYLAAIFVFFGSGAIIAYALWKGDTTLAKETFNVVLPIGTGVVTYWFAGRSAEKVAEGSNSSTKDEGKDKADQGDNQ